MFLISQRKMNCLVGAVLMISCQSAAPPLSEQPGVSSVREIAPMPVGRGGHGAVALGGRIYVIGGSTNDEDETARMDVFDIASNRWTRKADLPVACGFVPTVAVKGRLYAVAGEDRPGRDSFLFEYDPDHDRWKKLTTLPAQRRRASLAVLENKIYVIGGMGANSSGLSSKGEGRAPTRVFVFDVDDLAWSDGPELPDGKSDGLGVAVLNRQIHVFGGVGDGIIGIDIKEHIALIKGAWKPLATLPIGQIYHGAAAANGKLYAIGGRGDLTSVQVYDPKTNSWTLGKRMPIKNQAFPAVPSQGLIYVFGGAGYLSGFLAGVYRYDPAKDRWMEPRKNK